MILSHPMVTSSPPALLRLIFPWWTSGLILVFFFLTLSLIVLISQVGFKVLETTSLKWTCWQGHGLSKDLRENASLLLPRFWCLLAILDFLWLETVSFQSLSPSFHAFFHYVSVSNFPFLDRYNNIGFTPLHNSIWLHFNLITSAKVLFPNKVTFTGVKVGTWIYPISWQEIPPLC